MAIQDQDAFRTPKRQDQIRSFPCHYTLTLSIKNRERILKNAREKQQVTCKGKSFIYFIRIASDFSTKI
jgi:hypothetical protein